MVTNTGIKFYVKNLGASSASTFSTDNTGSIVFDKTAHALFVNGTQYGGNVSDATFLNNLLTITKADGTTVQLDFSTLATAASVMAAFNQIQGELNNFESAIGNCDSSDGEWHGYGGNTNYLDSAQTLTAGDLALDSAIKSVSDRVEAIVGGDVVTDIDIIGDSTTVDITDASDGEAHISVDGDYNATTNKIATVSTVTNALSGLDGTATIASKSDDVVTIKTGVTQTNGEIDNDSGTDIVLEEVATTGAAADVSVADSGDKFTATDVEGVLAEIQGNIETLDSSLADVATSGAAVDVSITDSGSNFTATDVEGALAELATTAGSAVQNVKVNGTTIVSNNEVDLSVDGTYSSSNKIATQSTVTNAIGALDVPSTGEGAITGFGAGKTLATLTETDGKIAATFQDISITASQISDRTTNLVTSVKGDGTYLEPSSAAKGDVTVSHKTRTETSTTSTGTVGSGNTGTTGTFDVVTYTFDAAGHETAKDTKTITVTFPSAADLGLSGAMHFKGTQSSLPTPTTSDSYENGDVILVGNKEYVRSGKTDSAAGSWVELGDESSYALNTITINGDGVLDGGGDLTQNRTITHKTSGVTTGTYSTNSTTSLTNGGTFKVPTLTVDSYGHITAASDTTLTLPTITVNDGALTIQGDTNGPITVAPTGSGYTANSSTGETYTITHSAGPTTSQATPLATKVGIDYYGHAVAGDALTSEDILIISGDPAYDSNATVSDALQSLSTSITNAGITIDGHKGVITTGNGLTHVAADGGSFAVNIDSSNANGLSVGANGVAMAKATGSTFGTVKVTTGNGLTLTDGVVAYAHNTSAITVASKDTTSNVVTINGTLTPDASDAITTSNAITLAAVAATGAAANVSIADSGSNFTATDVEGALVELAAKTATVVDAVGANNADEVVIVNGGKTTIATVDGSPISTTVAFYWEEYA